MFSNFRKAFITRPQFTARTPQVILDQVNNGLPDGFKYVNDPNNPGFCRIDCNDGLTISPASVKLSKAAMEIFSGKSTISYAEMRAFCYNSQTKAELLPDENGDFFVNGKRINIKNFVAAPLKDIRFENEHLYIVPPPFPDPFPVQVGGNGHIITLNMKRQPNNSLTVSKYASVNSPGIKLEYSFDPSKTNGKMQISIATTPSSSAEEVLAAKEVFNAFVCGTGQLCGAQIQATEAVADKMISQEVLLFWKKVVAVEKKLGAHFDVSNEIEMDDVKCINKLYRCLVEDLPYKEYRKDAMLSGEGDFQARPVAQYIGKEITVEFIETGELEILGISIKLEGLTALFDGVVSEITAPENGQPGEFRVKLMSASGKRLYASTQLFLDPEELKTFGREQTHIEILRKARELAN